MPDLRNARASVLINKSWRYNDTFVLFSTRLALFLTLHGLVHFSGDIRVLLGSNFKCSLLLVYRELINSAQSLLLSIYYLQISHRLMNNFSFLVYSAPVRIAFGPE